MTTLTAEPQSMTAGTGPPLLLEPRHWLAALAILFVFFAPYQTLVQTVITDDAVRLGIEADEYDMIWVTVAYGVGVLYGVFMGLSLSARIGMRYTLVLGMLVFSLGNVLCGAATGLVGLALGRFVEGFGKMVAMAVCRATLYKQFDRALLVAIGFYGVFAYSTRHLTPLVNAYLDVYLSWRWMYWAYVPVGLSRRFWSGGSSAPTGRRSRCTCRSTGWPSRHSWPGSWRSCSPSPGTANGVAGRRTRLSPRSCSASPCRWCWSSGLGRA